MQYRTLGRTDLEVSAVGMGCWAIADPRIWGPQDERDSIDAIRASLDAGVNLVDTAEGYGHGYSEELVGRALEGRRDGVVICTKASPEHHRHADLIWACENSLRRLRTDHIDLYLLHWPNHTIGFDEPAGALERLRDQGKVRHIGVANFAKHDLTDFLSRCRVEADELPYSLLWRAIEYEATAACVENEVGILCYSPLMQGLLTGSFLTADDVPPGQARSGHFSSSRPMAPHNGQGAEAETFTTIHAIRRISSSTGHPMTHLALAWLLSRPGVTSAIVGSRSAQEAVSNAAAADLSLSDHVLASLTDGTNGLKERFGSENPDMWQLPYRMR